ncbi:hypothetical protein N6H14_09200 [Paenibacillus sp. CC-CFT747]|nr:hypothetical protein N6H14_09200 [Paenibacillus sp. CC-CFT747]
MEWDAAEGGQGPVFYKIYKDGELYDLVPSTRYLATGLHPGETTEFRVVAGSETFSWNDGLPPVEVTTLSLPETDAPGAVTDVKVVPDYGVLRVAWTNPADADLAGIRVMWRKVGSDLFGEQKIGAGMEEAVLNVRHGSRYELKIIAVDIEGNEAETPLILASALEGPVIERLSEAPDGTSGNGESKAVSISRDGRYLVYETRSTNLLYGETSGGIMLYDRTAGENRVISVKADGSPVGGVSTPRISSNGRYILYHSISPSWPG